MTDERQTPQAEDQEAAGEERPVIQAELQQVRVGSFDGVKAALESMMNARENAAALLLFRMLMPGRFLLHQIHDKCRHQRAGKEVRRQQRENHSFGQGYEEVARNSSEEKHRYEHDADG